MTIKQMALAVLGDHPTGLSNTGIFDAIRAKFDQEVAPKSLSPQLGRLADKDGKIVKENGVWKLAEKKAPGENPALFECPTVSERSSTGRAPGLPSQKVADPSPVVRSTFPEQGGFVKPPCSGRHLLRRQHYQKPNTHQPSQGLVALR